MKISAVVLTKNEEKNIERCLNSVKFVDEIVIIDDYSEDKTIEIVHEVLKVYKVHKVYKVIKRKLSDDFTEQRNFGLEKATGEWILFIDGDEEVTAELSKEIQSLIRNPQSINCFYIKRRDFFWGKELSYGETAKARNKGIVRLVKKGSGHWLGKVHEEFKTDAMAGNLSAFINHYPHQNLKEFIEEINFYSSVRAQELFQLKKKFCLCQAIINPFFKFCLNYFIYLGFLDGVPGFIYAFMMAFHSFLVRAKLYQIQTEYEKTDSGN